LDLQVENAFSAQINATGLWTEDVRRSASLCRWNTLSGEDVDTLPIKSNMVDLSHFGYRQRGAIDVTPDSFDFDGSRMRATTVGITARLDDSRWIITYIQKINMQQY
jgi:hypothetical protein